MRSYQLLRRLSHQPTAHPLPQRNSGDTYHVCSGTKSLTTVPVDRKKSSNKYSRKQALNPFYTRGVCIVTAVSPLRQIGRMSFPALKNYRGVSGLSPTMT